MTCADTVSPTPQFSGLIFDRLLIELANLSPSLEQHDAWPVEQFRFLSNTGVLGWVIPRHYGGMKVDPVELSYGYQRLAEACLVTTFVLTQRNGACQRIAGSENGDLKADLLPRLSAGESFATVGISHLTTSRQHLKQPAVQVREAGTDYVFTGTVPWVTGAKFADYIVTGGTCADGRQVLAAIPTAGGGVETKEPARLMALNASQTGSVQLTDVAIDAHYLIAGPVEQVMKRGAGGGAGSLTTSALAIGAAGAALSLLQSESEKRADLVEIYEPLAAERERVAQDMYAAARGVLPDEQPACSTESIRQRANSLVLRATQAYLAASKGAGFVAGHPAERMVREAMFFLVWSCPQPVLQAALREFACLIDG